MDTQVVSSQVDPANSLPFGINTDILKVKCRVKTCSTMVLRTTTKSMPLCGSHTVSRDAMYQQASKTKNGQELVKDLQEMERHQPEQFLDHLQNFSEECPGFGRGKKRKTWDFARIKVVNQSGSRNEEWQRMKPLCKADFVDFYVNKAPSYRRLDQSAAEKLWATEFASKDTKKDQVSAHDRSGRDIGKVWRIWVSTDDGATDIKYQDMSVAQERGDEQQNPSEKSMQIQKETAVSMWADLEQEESLVPSIGPPRSTHSTAAPTPASGSSSSRGSKNSKGVYVPDHLQPDSRQAHSKPGVEAAKQRTKTMRDFKAVEIGLKRAMATGERMLGPVALQIHENDQEKVKKDASLELLRKRMEILTVAMDPSGGPEGEAASKTLLQACLSDPFLKELQSTLLAEADGVQTFGKIKHIRDTVLDIQPSGQRVVEMMDFQRNAMALLQRIVACVEKEAESWKTGVQALQKAYAEEEKAKNKAEEKVKKDAERKAAQAAKAAAKKERQLKDKQEKAAAQAAAAAAAAEHQSGSDDDEGKKQRRRRTGAAAGELSPSDPAVLRTLRVAPEVSATQVLNDVKEFLTHICTHPELPAVCRLKKGMTKKVLSVSPGLPSAHANTMSKVLNADAQKFAAEAAQNWSTLGATNGRSGSTMDGPGDKLGMDLLFQCEIDRLLQTQANKDSICDTVINRETFTKLVTAAASNWTPSISEDAAKKEVYRVSGVTWAGSQQGSVYTGPLPGGLGALCYQYEGNRLVASADALELTRFKSPHIDALIKETNIKSTTDFKPVIQAACETLRDLDDSGALAGLPSLRVTYIIPGDIMYVPFARLICEKTLGTGNSIALRVSTCLVSTHQALQAQYMRRALDESVGAKIYLDFMSKVKQEQSDADAANPSAAPAAGTALPVMNTVTASKPEPSDDHGILALIESLLCTLASKDEEAPEGFDEDIALQEAVELAPKHSLHPAFVDYIKNELCAGEEWEWANWEGDILEDLRGFVDFVHLKMPALFTPTTISGDDGSHLRKTTGNEPATNGMEEKPEETTGTGGSEPNGQETTGENQNEAGNNQQPKVATKASETATIAPTETVENHEAAGDLEIGFAQELGNQEHGESFVEAGVATTPSLPAPTGKLETAGAHVLPPNSSAPASTQAKAEEKLEDPSAQAADTPGGAHGQPQQQARRLTTKSAPEEKRTEDNADKPTKCKGKNPDDDGEGKATGQVEKEENDEKKKSAKKARKADDKPSPNAKKRKAKAQDKEDKIAFEPAKRSAPIAKALGCK